MACVVLSVPLATASSSTTCALAASSDESAGSNGDSPTTVVSTPVVMPRLANESCLRSSPWVDARESPEASSSSVGCGPMWAGSPSL